MRLLKLKNINTEYRYIAIFAIIMSLQMFFIDTETFPSTQYEGDQGGYFIAANNLYSNFSVHNIRPLGYPLFLGIPNMFGYKTPAGYWHVILNILFFISTLIVVKRIGSLFNYNLVFGVGIGLCISTGYVLLITKALTEIGYVFFVLLGIYMFIKFYKTQKGIDIFLAFFSFGFATLFRPGFIYLLFFLITVTVFYLFYQKSCNKTHVFFAILGLSLTIGVQSLMMKKQLDTYKISYVDDLAWYLYGSIITDNVANDCYWSYCYNEIYEKRDSLILNHLNLYTESEALKKISLLSRKDRSFLLNKEPKSILKMFYFNIKNNLIACSNNSSGTVLAFYPNQITFITKSTNLILSITPFILFLLFIFFKRKYLSRLETLMLVVSLLVISYSILTSGISAFQGDRFHVSFYPISIMLITFFIKKLKHEQTTKAINNNPGL